MHDSSQKTYGSIKTSIDLQKQHILCSVLLCLQAPANAFSFNLI